MSTKSLYGPNVIFEVCQSDDDLKIVLRHFRGPKSFRMLSSVSKRMLRTERRSRLLYTSFRTNDWFVGETDR